MDEDIRSAGPDLEAEASVASRLDALASAVPPPEIAELWVFPPLAELESSAEFFLFTRFLEGHRRALCSARLQREEGASARQVVVEHGSVPADRVPRLVQRLQRRVGDEGQPVHRVIEGCEARWRELLEGPPFGDGGRRNGGAATNGAGSHGAAANGAVANGNGARGRD